MVQELTGTPLQFETSSGLVGPSTPQEKDKKKEKKVIIFPTVLKLDLLYLNSAIKL